MNKVLALILKHSELSSVEEFISRYKDGRDLHIVLQKTVNEVGGTYAPKYVHFLLGLLKDFLKFYDVEIGRPWEKLELPKKAEVRVDRVPSIAEIQKLILATHSERIRVIIQTMLQTGLRFNEALTLKVANIDFDNKVIRLGAVNSKTGRGREVPLCRELLETLKNYLARRRVNSQWLFPSYENPSKPMNKFRFYRTYYEILKRLHLDMRDPSNTGYVLRPHVFRKWFKTQLERAGVNRLLIEMWSGRTVGVQGVYFLPTGEDMRREFEKAERALTIFGKSEEPKPALDPRFESLLARNQLMTLKLIENEIIKNRLFAMRQKDQIRLAELDRQLQSVRERMAELTSLVSREELERLDQLADELS